MTGRPTFDQLLADWIEDGPTDAPDRVLETVIAAIPSIPQRRGALAMPRRLSAMNMPARLAAVAAIGVVVVGVALLLARPARPVVGGPSPAPGLIASPSAPASPSAAPSSSVVQPRPSSWTSTGSMITPRPGATATLLPDGRVLVAGGDSPSGVLASAELYDPRSGTWTATGSMTTPRVGHTATLLPDGMVLVSGGAATHVLGMHQPPSVASAELYDPATGVWTATSSMGTPRTDHTATLLRDGKVLVAGGGGPGSAIGYTLPTVASAELYDPATGTWIPTGSMAQSRSGQTATLLPDGRVLVAGGGVSIEPADGTTGGGDLSSTEVYDPASGSWTTAGSMAGTAGGFTTALLSNGKVLHVGVPAELYDPASGSWTATGNMLTPRGGEGVTLLPDGTVLVEGGAGGGSVGIASAELYDPASGTWTATASPGWGSQSATATLLLDGKVLVAGGGADGRSAELYDPGSPGPTSSVVAPKAPSWTATGSMGTPREGHTATLLPDGEVLVAGGYNGGTPLASAELYDPASGTWTATGSMVAARGGHTATLLPDGKVLAAGCANGTDAPSAELYDPGTGSWTATGSMVTPRCLDFTATLLLDGRVLVAGGMGTGNGHILASAELYDPGTGSWTATGSMTSPRYDHTATLLPGGTVLVTGGADHGGASCCYLASAELYDPASGSWTATGSMGAPHGHHTATLLPDGKVLVTGSSELYDPATGSWTLTKNPTTTFAVRATLLTDGRVLVVGLVMVGDAEGSSVELYDPGSGSWTATGGKGTSRYRNGFTATLLADGRVLVAGGFSGSQCGDGCMLKSAELYDPGSP